MHESTDNDRRRFLRTALLGLAVGELSAFVPLTVANAALSRRPTMHPPLFGPVKQIDAGVLNVGYVDAGLADAPAVILLHGWPYDIHSFAEVVPLLTARGHRVIVPYLRGYGATSFLSASTPRNGQQAALGVDTVALMDALKIERAILAGFDWGARTANVVAALWPERCRGLVSVSGYLIGSQEANKIPLPPSAEQAWWYQYYFAT
jgi:pimeloyl-ACP methyl ester carboxylesterase